MLLFLAAALLVLLVYRFHCALIQQAPIQGRIETHMADFQALIGTYNVQWSAETRQLRIFSERLVWQSVPGESFVCAARAWLCKTEGHFPTEFKLTDRRLVTYAIQTLDDYVQEGQTLTLSGVLKAGMRQVPYTLRLTASSEQQLLVHITVDSQETNRVYLRAYSAVDEKVFGFGTQYSYFDFKGQLVPIIVRETGVGRGKQPLSFVMDLLANAGGSPTTSYAAVPYFMTSNLNAFYLEGYDVALFDLRRDNEIQIGVLANTIQGCLIWGESPARVIETYTASVGRMRQLPRWVYSGAIVGLEGGTEFVRGVYEQLKQREVPIAAFWLQDWVGERTTGFGYQLDWNWKLNQEWYPGWNELAAEFAQDDIRIMTYVNPYLQQGFDLYNEALERGYFIKNRQGQAYRIWYPGTSAGMIDLTNPAAWKWYKSVLVDHALIPGVHGWMADYAEGAPLDAVYFNGDSPLACHNRYTELWAQFNREIVDQYSDAELVTFHRSGYTHSPCYAPLFWVGDQLTTWDAHQGFKTAVLGMLNSGLCGFSYNHSDIGGYLDIDALVISVYTRSQELLLRWIELNAFTTIFRTHVGSKPDLNAQIYSSETTYDFYSRFAKVYRAWEFYRHELVQEAAATGLPVIRHPFIHYHRDPVVANLSYEQFMVGSEWMVAPVLDPGKEQVRVYLPAGEWIHLWSGQAYGEQDRGVWLEVAAPLGEPALFYQAGSPVGEQLVENLKQVGLFTP